MLLDYLLAAESRRFIIFPLTHLFDILLTCRMLLKAVIRITLATLTAECAQCPKLDF